MSLIDMIGEKARERKTTFAQIERELGFSNGSIRKWGTNNPTIDKVKSLADFFGVSVDYLLGSQTNDDSDEADETTEVLVYDEPAAAGLGTYLSDYAPYENLSFPKSEVPRRTDCGIRIKGDSMEPEIESGEIVFVELTPIVEIGEIGIFVHDERAYCKRLEIDRQRRVIMLTSVNADYEPIVIKRDSVLRTVGRVLKSRH